MRNTLVRTDRRLPHRALVRELHRGVQGVTAHSDGHRRAQDALGVEAGEQLHQSGIGFADQSVGRQTHIVEKEDELVVRFDDVHLHLRLHESGRIRGDDEQSGLELARLGVLGARNDENRISLIDTRDVNLVPAQDPVFSVTPSSRRDLMRVGTSVRLGDSERHDLGSVGEAG